MKTTTIREFRSKIAELISSEDSVIVTRHGKPAAVLFSLRDPKKIPAELRRKLYVAMASEIAKQLETKKISDEQIERDFREHQKRRRR
ncbi:MAG TPA: type II toxin-antitoxin system Phd/YefM family antitoxin [Thermoanaerobaculia bacterium]|nr:type II toxin-antitoxin system Phd/YefM family antitoxin [Thermoanaerobaculia bacterium]